MGFFSEGIPPFFEAISDPSDAFQRQSAVVLPIVVHIEVGTGCADLGNGVLCIIAEGTIACDVLPDFFAELNEVVEDFLDSDY